MKKFLSMFLIGGILSSSSINVISCSSSSKNTIKHKIDLSNKSIDNLDFKATADEYESTLLKVTPKVISEIYYKVTNDKFGESILDSSKFNNEFDLSLKLIDNKTGCVSDLLKNYGEVFFTSDELNDSFKLEVSFDSNSKIIKDNNEYDYIKSSLEIDNFIISRSYKIDLSDIQAQNDISSQINHNSFDVNITNDDLWNAFFNNFIEYYGLESLGLTKEKLLINPSFLCTFYYCDYSSSDNNWVYLRDDKNQQLFFPNAYKVVISIVGSNPYFISSNDLNYYDFGIIPKNINRKSLDDFKIVDNKIILNAENANGFDLMYEVTSLIYNFLGGEKILLCINLEILKGNLNFKILDSSSNVISGNTPLISNARYTINISTKDISFNDDFDGFILDGNFLENINVSFSLD